MRREVLGAGRDDGVVGIVALQAADVGGGDLGRQVRILAIGLLATPPTRITQDVDGRTPKGQTGIDATIAAGLCAMVLGPLPIAALGILGLRALRRDPTQRGKGRAIFALVVAGIMGVPVLISLPFLLLRR